MGFRNIQEKLEKYFICRNERHHNYQIFIRLAWNSKSVANVATAMLCYTKNLPHLPLPTHVSYLQDAGSPK